MVVRNKTVPTGADVAGFVAAIADDRRRADAALLIAAMSEVTGAPPVIWGTSIVGFGSRHLRYDSGRELDVPRVAFAPRAAQSVVYVSGGFDRYQDLLPLLGRHSTGNACLYLKNVADADPAALREVIDRSYRWIDGAEHPDPADGTSVP